MSKENIVKTKATNLLVALGQSAYSTKESLRMFMEAREIIDNIEKNNIDNHDLDDWSDRLEDLQSDFNYTVKKEQECRDDCGEEYLEFSKKYPKL